MHHPTDRITHTTAFVKPVGEHWLLNDKNKLSLTHTPLYKLAPIVNKELNIAPVVRAFAHGAMGRRIDPSWWTH